VESEAKEPERKSGLPDITPPKVDIRPEIQNMIDEFASKILPNMTAHEIQYFIQKTGLMPATMQKPKALPSAATKKRPVEPLPEMRDWQAIMDAIEEHVTEGFEEPKAIIPLHQQRESNPLLELITDKLGGFLENVSKNPKVQDSLANLLDALAKKIGEGK